MKLLLPLLISLALTACLPRPGPAPARSPARPQIVLPVLTPEQSDELRGQIVVSAITQSGKNYRYGGNGPEDFDCSGLVRFVYSQVGITVPRTTLTLLDAGVPVSMAQARPGDLLFYRFEDSPGPASHVMIYIGNNEAIHAPAGGKVVRSANVGSSAFTRRFIAARRLLN